MPSTGVVHQLLAGRKRKAKGHEAPIRAISRSSGYKNHEYGAEKDVTKSPLTCQPSSSSQIDRKTQEKEMECRRENSKEHLLPFPLNKLNEPLLVSKQGRYPTETRPEISTGSFQTFSDIGENFEEQEQKQEAQQHNRSKRHQRRISYRYSRRYNKKMKHRQIDACGNRNGKGSPCDAVDVSMSSFAKNGVDYEQLRDTEFLLASRQRRKRRLMKSKSCTSANPIRTKSSSDSFADGLIQSFLEQRHGKNITSPKAFSSLSLFSSLIDDQRLFPVLLLGVSAFSQVIDWCDQKQKEAEFSKSRLARELVLWMRDRQELQSVYTSEAIAKERADALNQLAEFQQAVRDSHQTSLKLLSQQREEEKDFERKQKMPHVHFEAQRSEEVQMEKESPPNFVRKARTETHIEMFDPNRKKIDDSFPVVSNYSLGPPPKDIGQCPPTSSTSKGRPSAQKSEDFVPLTDFSSVGKARVLARDLAEVRPRSEMELVGHNKAHSQTIEPKNDKPDSDYNNARREITEAKYSRNGIRPKSRTSNDEIDSTQQEENDCNFDISDSIPDDLSEVLLSQSQKNLHRSRRVTASPRILSDKMLSNSPEKYKHYSKIDFTGQAHKGQDRRFNDLDFQSPPTKVMRRKSKSDIPQQPHQSSRKAWVSKAPKRSSTFKQTSLALSSSGWVSNRRARSFVKNDVSQGIPPIAESNSIADIVHRKKDSGNDKGDSNIQGHGEKYKSPLGTASINQMNVVGRKKSKVGKNAPERNTLGKVIPPSSISFEVEQKQNTGRQPRHQRGFHETNTHEKDSSNDINDLSISSDGRRDDGMHNYAYEEVVRGKAAREALIGYECKECAAFFDEAVLHGDGSKYYDRDELLRCSRHRARQTPPQTPEDYWELSFADEREERLKQKSGK